MDSDATSYLDIFKFECHYLCGFLVALGCITFFKFVFKFLVVLMETFVLPGTNLEKFGANNGAWAVVTGASDGIGREYAIQLAEKGFNILAVARNEAALTAVTDEIVNSTFGSQVQTKRVIFDVSEPNAAGWNLLENIVQKIQVGILVNNVGRSHHHQVYFAETPSEEMNGILSVNINATMRITRMISPGMSQRKCGLILNIGSFSGIVPTAMLATYSASKAFLDTFSTALAEEMKKDGVMVQCLNSYFFVSKLSNIRKPSFFAPTPTAFVRASLSKVGLKGGARFSGRPAASSPYWTHSILNYGFRLLGMHKFIVKYKHISHVRIRQRYDRRKADANMAE